MKESPHPVQTHNVPTAKKFERLRQTRSAHNGLSFYCQARSEPEPATSSLPVRAFSWHSASRAM